MSIIASIVNARRKKLKAKALYEYEIVIAIREHISNKVSKLENENKAYVQKLKNAQEMIRAKKNAGTPQRELDRMLLYYEHLQIKYDANYAITNDFIIIDDLLCDFAMYFSTLVDVEEYSFLIRLIWKIKLRYMGNNVCGTKKIIEMLTSLINECELRLTRLPVINPTDEFKEAKERIRAYAAVLKERYNDSLDYSAYIAALFAEEDDIDDHYTKPTPAPTTADAVLINTKNH